MYDLHLKKISVNEFFQEKSTKISTISRKIQEFSFAFHRLMQIKLIITQSSQLTEQSNEFQSQRAQQ
jgi:hypothetical protein